MLVFELRRLPTELERCCTSGRGKKKKSTVRAILVLPVFSCTLVFQLCSSPNFPTNQIQCTSRRPHNQVLQNQKHVRSTAVFTCMAWANSSTWWCQGKFEDLRPDLAYIRVTNENPNWRCCCCCCCCRRCRCCCYDYYQYNHFGIFSYSTKTSYFNNMLLWWYVTISYHCNELLLMIITIVIIIIIIIAYYYYHYWFCSCDWHSLLLFL